MNRKIRHGVRDCFLKQSVPWLAALGLAGCALMESPEIKRGDQHLAAGNWEEASRAYKQALQGAPFDAALQGKYVLARERAAAMYEERGRGFLKEKQFDFAIEEFKRALTIEPSNAEHQTSLLEATRMKESRSQHREAERLAQLGRTDEAMNGFMRAAELDPTYREPLDSISRLSEAQQGILRGDRLKQPVTLKFKNAGIKEVLEGVATAGGFSLIFDKDVRNDPVSIAVQDTPFEDALRLVLNSNSLFSRQVSPTVLIISPNTKQKQEQYQDLMIRTFYLSTAKAKDMLALLKGILESKKMHANEQQNAIIIRDQPEKLELAERIIQANDRQESEVLFDLEVLEVNRTKNQTYGLDYPKQAGAGLVASAFTGTLAAQAVQMSMRQLTDLGSSNYLFKLPSTVILDFFKQQTDAKTLASPKVRVINNKKAEINIGDKQPILLSTTNVLPGQAVTGAVPTTSTVTSIEFRDTGVKLTVEPSIRLGNELSLKMKVEVVRVGEQVTLQAQPLIQQFKFGNRSAETTLNMRDGETIVLGGLLQEDDRRTRTTIPWIGDLPYIGNILSSYKTERVTTEVILTITPHITQPLLPAGPRNHAFWSGTELSYATGPMFSPGPQVVSTMSGGGSATPAHGGTRVGMVGRGDGSQSLADLGTPKPVLALQPEVATVPLGKEVTLMFLDGRIRGEDQHVFKLEYDPGILEFRSLGEAEVVSSSSPDSTDAGAPAAGTVMFRLAHPEQRGPRSVGIVFVPKALGVSTVRVELSGVGGESAPLSEVARGVVKVR